MSVSFSPTLTLSHTVYRHTLTLGVCVSEGQMCRRPLGHQGQLGPRCVKGAWHGSRLWGKRKDESVFAVFSLVTVPAGECVCGLAGHSPMKVCLEMMFSVTWRKPGNECVKEQGSLLMTKQFQGKSLFNQHFWLKQKMYYCNERSSDSFSVYSVSLF